MQPKTEVNQCQSKLQQKNFQNYLYNILLEVITQIQQLSEKFRGATFQQTLLQNQYSSTSTFLITVELKFAVYWKTISFVWTPGHHNVLQKLDYSYCYEKYELNYTAQSLYRVEICSTTKNRCVWVYAKIKVKKSETPTTSNLFLVVASILSTIKCS